MCAKIQLIEYTSWKATIFLRNDCNKITLLSDKPATNIYELIRTSEFGSGTTRTKVTNAIDRWISIEILSIDNFTTNEGQIVYSSWWIVSQFHLLNRNKMILFKATSASYRNKTNKTFKNIVSRHEYIAVDSFQSFFLSK